MNYLSLKKIFAYEPVEAGYKPSSGISIVKYEEAMEKESNKFEPDESVNQETESLIVYTSGTTGLPKGVVLTQYNLIS